MKKMLTNSGLFPLIIIVLCLCLPCSSWAKPQCELISSNPGPPITLTFSFQDADAGLRAISTLESDNVSVTVSPFPTGVSSAVNVTVTQVDVGLDITVVLEGEGMDGSTTTCSHTTADPPEDNAPPVFSLTNQNPGPPASVSIGVQDTASGLSDIQVTTSSNASVSPPDFSAGTTAQVVVSASQTTEGLDFSFTLRATDVNGNASTYEYSYNQEDLQPPAWQISSEEPGPPYTVYIDIQDIGSGLKSISVTDSLNAQITVPEFQEGITTPAVIVRATRESEEEDFAFRLELEDMAGNKTDVTYNLAMKDDSPPDCRMSFFDAGPPVELQISIQDTGSGLSTIKASDSYNAVYSIPAFTQGTKESVIVDVAQIEEHLEYHVQLEATDMQGNRADCTYPDAFQILSRSEFDAVGNDRDNHFQDIYKANAIENSLNNDGRRINQYSNFAEEKFFSDSGLPMPDPCFSFATPYESVLTRSWSQGEYAWEITLQMKPLSDLSLQIAGCILQPGSNNVLQDAAQTGTYRMAASPELLRFIPSANPTVTVEALPGKAAAANFPANGFGLDVRDGPNLTCTSATDVRFISRSSNGETINLVLPANGAVNASGQTIYELNAGDRIRVTIRVPYNNTGDLRFGKDNVCLFYTGAVGTELTASN